MTDTQAAMIWFFERQHSRLHYEIRRQTDGHDYELVITYPDGRQEVELYRDSSAVVERSAHLQNALLRAGWQPPGQSRAPARATGEILNR